MNELLTTVYDEYNRYIYHLCLKLTRKQNEAEDLMQEVWVKVVRYEASVAEVDHVKAWLTTITMNTFRDRYRKNVRRSKYMMSQPAQPAAPTPDYFSTLQPQCIFLWIVMIMKLLKSKSHFWQDILIH